MHIYVDFHNDKHETLRRNSVTFAFVSLVEFILAYIIFIYTYIYTCVYMYIYINSK